MDTPPITAELAAFATGLRWQDVPADAGERIVLHVLDQVGAAIAGSATTWVAAVRDYAVAETPDGACTILGAATTGRPEWAALANGTAGHGLEIDDWHLPALVHPGCVVVPTVLALGEDRGARGHAALAAAAAGFETIVRLGLATTPSMTSDRGFHVTGVHGPLGGAAAAASLTGLTSEAAQHALALATSHASGLTEYTISGGEVKRLHAGLAAMGGIRSAALASRGFTGPWTAIEGRRGYLQAFAARARPDAVMDGLGTVWHSAQLAAKPYFACAGIHAPIAALEELRSRGLVAGDVEELSVGFARASLEHVGHIGPRPRDMAGAQFSAEYSLAMNLVLGGNDLPHYRRAEEAGFDLPDVVELAERVTLHVDPDADAAFPRRIVARVTARRRNGTELAAEAVSPGSSEAPLSRAEMVRKFRSLAGSALPEREVDAIERAVFALADDAPVADVLGPLRRRP